MPKTGECFAFGSELTAALSRNPSMKLLNRNWKKQLKRERKEVGKLRKDRLALLIRWSNIVIGPRRNRNNYKRRLWAQTQAELCWCCWNRRELVRHHIIQLQHGGRNLQCNIVSICKLCHAEIHPWMELEEGLMSDPEPMADYKHLP